MSNPQLLHVMPLTRNSVVAGEDICSQEEPATARAVRRISFYSLAGRGSWRAEL